MPIAKKLEVAKAAVAAIVGLAAVAAIVVLAARRCFVAIVAEEEAVLLVRFDGVAASITEARVAFIFADHVIGGWTAEALVSACARVQSFGAVSASAGPLSTIDIMTLALASTAAFCAFGGSGACVLGASAGRG